MGRDTAAKNAYGQAYMRDRYRDLRARGICTDCGCADAEAQRTKCRACLDRHPKRRASIAKALLRVS